MAWWLLRFKHQARERPCQRHVNANCWDAGSARGDTWKLVERLRASSGFASRAACFPDSICPGIWASSSLPRNIHCLHVGRAVHEQLAPGARHADLATEWVWVLGPDCTLSRADVYELGLCRLDAAPVHLLKDCLLMAGRQQHLTDRGWISKVSLWWPYSQWERRKECSYSVVFLRIPRVSYGFLKGFLHILSSWL